MIQKEPLARAPAREGANDVAPEMLRAFVERIERLEGEITALNDDKKEVYAEIKSAGFDTKIVKKVIALRRKDHAERKEEEAIMELYLEALDMR
jgi:uncharacterized protein (UPF0335 family)